MPTYEYKCPKCRTVFEVLQKMTDKPAAKCPKCGAKAERQMSGGHGLHFKGTGFYETDYKRAGQKKPPAEGGSGAGKDSPGRADSGGASPSVSPNKRSGGAPSDSSSKPSEGSSGSSGSSSSGSSD
jgi:putative FmdB family regulatory protein